MSCKIGGSGEAEVDGVIRDKFLLCRRVWDVKVIKIYFFSGN